MARVCRSGYPPFSRAGCCGSFIERFYRNKTLSLKKLPGMVPGIARAGFEPATRPCVAFPVAGAVLPLNYRTTLTSIKSFFVIQLVMYSPSPESPDVSIVLYFPVFLFLASSGSGCIYSGWSDALAGYAKPGLHTTATSKVSPVNIPVCCQWKQLITRYTGLPFKISPPSFLNSTTCRFSRPSSQVS